MRLKEPWVGVLAATLLAGAAIPVHATSLMRAGLNDLTTANSTIVLGEVVELSSYWAECKVQFADRNVAQDRIEDEERRVIGPRLPKHNRPLADRFGQIFQKRYNKRPVQHGGGLHHRRCKAGTHNS